MNRNILNQISNFSDYLFWAKFLDFEHNSFEAKYYFSTFLCRYFSLYIWPLCMALFARPVTPSIPFLATASLHSDAIHVLWQNYHWTIVDFHLVFFCRVASGVKNLVFPCCAPLDSVLFHFCNCWWCHWPSSVCHPLSWFLGSQNSFWGCMSTSWIGTGGHFAPPVLRSFHRDPKQSKVQVENHRASLQHFWEVFSSRHLPKHRGSCSENIFQKKRKKIIIWF